MRVDTRRLAFDQWLFERANTPTLEDERERRQRAEVRRSLCDPPVTEVWSAKALNDLLAEFQDALALRSTDPRVPLQADLMQRINVTPAKGGGNIGLLRNAGRLDWPMALHSLEPRAEADALRNQLNAQFKDAVTQAAQGSVSGRLLQGIEKALDRINGLLNERVNDLTAAQYIEAKRFLVNLRDAWKALRQPDAANYFNGRYSAQGKTISDLIRQMMERGLQFAPATAGDEAAYLALHRAMVAHGTAVQVLPRGE